MSKDKSSSGGSGIGCLGPVDLGRSVYNGIIGDTPVLKQQLVDYSKRDIKKLNPNYSFQEVETTLSNELNYRLKHHTMDLLEVETTLDNNDSGINPQEVSIEKLWDASENHSKSWYKRWVWPSLEE